MAELYKQAERPLRITTPLGDDVLLVERFSGEESVSAPFRFRLDLLSEKSDIAPAALLGKAVTVAIDFDEETRHVNGIISRFGQAGRGVRLTRYTAELVPRLWTASLTRDSRIFQQKSVGDIAGAVLGSMKHSKALTASYEPRNFCAQYRESNLAFLSRLLEEEGIHYFHRHTQNDHELVLSDASSQAESCPGIPAKLRVAVAAESPSYPLEPLVYNVEREEAVVSGKVVLWDHHFQLPGDELAAERKIEKGAAELEIYDYPGGYARRFDGIAPGGAEQASEVQKIFDENKRVASIQAGEVEAGRTLVRGESNCPLLVPGHKFTLDRHYRADFNAGYFLVRVTHEASVKNYENADGEPFSYRASFEAIPITAPFVPARRTPRPRVEGAQTATVVGPEGAEIFSDKYGRVKVLFNWDRAGQEDQRSSCWVRVSTPWAGKNWGMVAIPRVGSEVIVDFLEGDPDRPIITGMVYNAATMPPYLLPDNMTQSGVKTRSTQKGAAENFNELRFEDKKGSEEIYLHAEKDLNAVIENNETRKVGSEKKDKGDQTLEIFNNQTVKVGAGAGEAAEGTQTLEVYKDQKVTLKTGDQTITLNQGNRSVTLDQGNETVLLKVGNRSVSIDTGNDELTIKTGNLTTTLKTGNASLELDVGNATTKAKVGKISEEAMQAIEMKVGQNSIKIDQTGVTIQGMMVKIEGQVQTQVKGLMTQINGDAMLTVKGGITMIN
jgi:type VI secretion system secreted protein VgrG